MGISIKEIVDKERDDNEHYYLYTAMRAVAKRLGISESTVDAKYYNKKLNLKLEYLKKSLKKIKK